MAGCVIRKRAVDGAQRRDHDRSCSWPICRACCRAFRGSFCLRWRRVRFLMWLNVCEAIANLSLSLLLVRRYGPAGVALGTLFPAARFARSWSCPFTPAERSKSRCCDLFRKGFSIPLFTGVLMAGIGMACVHVAPPNSWKIFFLDITCDCHTGRDFVPCLRFQPGGAQGATGASLAAAQWRTATTTH